MGPRNQSNDRKYQGDQGYRVVIEPIQREQPGSHRETKCRQTDERLLDGD